MDYGFILGVMGVAIVVAIGSALGYWIFVASRGKKLIWKAKVYQLGDGIIPPTKDSDGKIIADYKLSNLREYATDIVEQRFGEGGSTKYWLQTLKKSCPVVTADCVEKWGKDKFVSVLLEGDSCTLLKSGYDRRVGKRIFEPLPADTINMIKTEREERQKRIENKKDALSQIMPFVVAGLWIVGIIATAYIMGNAGVKMSEMNSHTAEIISDRLDNIGNIYKCQGLEANSTGRQVVQKEEPPTIPP